MAGPGLARHPDPISQLVHGVVSGRSHPEGGVFRVIARLDVKPPNVVKGVRLEGFRKMGKPADLAVRYYEQGADELAYQDVVASLYGYNSLFDLVDETTRSVFIPVTVGGGIKTVEQVRKMLRAGADKVIVNTEAIRRPEFISEIAYDFGCQCAVVAIEHLHGECLVNTGRDRTGLDALTWAKRAVDLGAGELLLTSVARDGTYQGFDLAFAEQVISKVRVPVLLHGGAGSLEHIQAAYEIGASGVVLASVLHYNRLSISEIKRSLLSAGKRVRV